MAVMAWPELKPGPGLPLMVALRTLLKRVMDCGARIRRTSAKARMETISPFLLRTEIR